HTCEFAEGNTWAKRITIQAVKVLGAQDEVGVIDYEGGEKWVFELTPAGEIEKMIPKINAAAPGDMPSFTGTMRKGLAGLKKSEEEGDIDPILAVTQYGLGKTAAFTSDLSPNWGADWMEWDKYAAFVHQLVTSISRVQKTGKLRMWTYTSGNEGVIVVEDFAEQESFLEIQTRVSGPRERTEIVPLKQVGPRRYQASVPLWGKGRYHIVA